MTNDQRTGGSGGFSQWLQRKTNARTVTRVRRGKGTSMGMDLLVLRTVGRRSGQQRETPLSWFADGADAWLVVASGGGKGSPSWLLNLTAHPDQTAVELPAAEPRPVAPQVLDGVERERAWQRIVAAQPRYAKYQAKSGRVYPLVRLTAR